MRKKTVFCLFLMAMLLMEAQAQQVKGTNLKVNLNGYVKKSVDITFMQTPVWNMRFPYNPQFPSEIDYTFDIGEIEGVYVNGQLIYVEPGNELVSRLNYSEGRLDNMEISTGNSPQTILANKLLQEIRQNRRQNRFKTQNLAWAIIGTTPEEQFQKSKRQLEVEKTLLDSQRSNLSESGYSYLTAESEAIIYGNMINYPMTYADTHNLPVDSCRVPEYATFLEDYALRSDAASLRNRNYCSFLVNYYTYNSMLEQLKKPTGERAGQEHEHVFRGLVEFYSGEVRDAALFAFLYLNMSNNSTDFSLIEKLTDEYFHKYNINKEYKTELERVMR